MSETKVQRNYKDSIFRMLFKDRENLLSLYNALNQTGYTVNPNMPLRDLFYVADILQKRTYDKDLYGSKLIKIPSPRFVVFYNGTDPQPERQTLKLSDAYEKKLMRNYILRLCSKRV